VSQDGDRLIVSAGSEDSDLEHNIGAVYVYERHGGAWTETARLSASDSRENLSFGSHGVSLDGNRMIVSTPNDKSVYIYDLINGDWVETKLLIEDTATQSWAVTLDGDRASIGNNIFEFRDGVWSKVAALVPSDDSTNASVRLEGDRAIVTGSFAAYIFERQNGAWVEASKLTRPDVFGTGYGSTVALSGDQAIVGASTPYINGVAGAAYAYSLIDGSWVETQTLTPSDGRRNDGFGQKKRM